jgi:DNA-binding Lrp family transcriptional regulator
MVAIFCFILTWFLEPKMEFAIYKLNEKYSLLYQIEGRDNIWPISLEFDIKVNKDVATTIGGITIVNDCLEVYWDEDDVYIKCDKKNPHFIHHKINEIGKPNYANITEEQYDSVVVNCKFFDGITYEYLKKITTERIGNDSLTIY